MLVRELVAKYLEYVRSNWSRNTFLTYDQRLSRLTKWYGNRSIESLTEVDVLDYFERAGKDATGNLMSPSTRRSNVTVFQALQRWAVQHRFLSKPIVTEFRKPTDRLRERIPTRREQAIVLWLAPRYVRRILMGLLLTGARPNELVNANIEHYDQTRRLIELHEHKTAAKTGRKRQIGVGKKLARILERCIGNRVHGPIFLNSRGERWSTQALSHVYRRLRLKAGLSDDLCLYAATRHYAGTEVCKKLGVAAASHFLGHASFTTTQRYVHPDPAMLSAYQDQVF